MGITLKQACQKSNFSATHTRHKISRAGKYKEKIKIDKIGNTEMRGPP